MFTPLMKTKKLRLCWLLLAGACALSPGLARAVPPKKAARSASTAAAAPISLSQRCRFRQATAEEMNQFHNELNRHGWQGAAVAAVAAGYAKENGVVQETGIQRATLYGDVDGDGQPEWVVGCNFPTRSRETAPVGPPEPGRSPGRPRDDRARIVIFKKDAADRAGRWHLHWCSPGLGYEFHSPEFNMKEVEQGLDRIENLRLPLSLLDVDGDRRLEIVYQCWSESPEVGGLPGIYRFDSGRWVTVTPQADRFSVRDLDGDGRLEVITGSRCVGYGMGDDDVPRVWRWKGRQYQEASRDFPRFYADLVSRYAAYVRRMEAYGARFNRVAWERAIQKATSLAS
jgi:hypothetical protein